VRPTPIPDDDIYAGEQRHTLGAPRGMEADVAPVECVLTSLDLGGRSIPAYRFRVEVPPEEAARLAAGEPFWLTFWGQVPPFALALHELPEESGG